jgi:opine dehydrogenase
MGSRSSKSQVSTNGRKRKTRYCVLGAGHGGLAMAGHLSLMGFTVTLWNRSPERIAHVVERGGIDMEGEVEGFAKLELATSNIKDAVKNIDVLMVVLPAYGHRFVAEQCAPYLVDGQIIVLNPGRTLGAIEFEKVLRDHGLKANVTVAETQTFIYVSRHVELARAHIFQIKNTVPLAALPAYRTPDVLKAIAPAYPQFISGTNVLVTSFDNIGAIFHPAITILNSARIEATHGNFEYYLEGATPSVCNVLEMMDKERRAVADALGVRTHSARDWLYLAYDSAGSTLYDAIQSTPGYRGVKAPTTVFHRYILEDVPMSLVPIASLGDHLGIPTPTIKSIIQIASTVLKRDFWKEGRTVKSLGLDRMSVKDLRLFVVEGKRRSKR